ncbi:hypothetical protein KC19_1G194400 [Ceratodon purpureus]|uniref:protein-tyrosine-phosphatase n=1 Tax=Ceratodon purpureus TaxID=3225 RepID=A0A8T0JAE7_CERPU|nr:hypothetical protein KC19_1G194400 [Ceratodon purpureus]
MPSSQILPWLWIGDEYSASAPEVHAFMHVLNITVEVEKCSSLGVGVTFQRFPIFDYGGDKQQELMFNFFGDACSVIDQGVASEKPVLVHCVEGKQRSCAVVAAYLIHAMGMTAAQAREYIVKKRPEAFDCGAHVNFAPALERWEKTSRSASASEEKEKQLPGGSSSRSKSAKLKKKADPTKNAVRKR